MSKKRKKKEKLRSVSSSAAEKNGPAGPQSSPGKRNVSNISFFSGHWRQLLIITFLAIGLYAQTYSFDYVLDDSILITENKYTQEGISGIGDIFRYESFHGHFGDKQEMVEGGRYRPFSIATFAIEQSLTGGSSSFSHIINVILYILTGILLYRVLLILFPVKGSSAPGSGSFWNLAFAATLIFIAHPLHVEVVANIKGRDEILAMLGELGVLYFSFKWLSDKKNRHLFFSFLCYFLGILSKEGVITFLAIVPVSAYFFTKSSISDKLRIMLPLLAGTFIYLIIRMQALGYLYTGAEITNLMNNPFYGMSFGDKYATVFYTLLLYLKLLLIPYPLTHDYYPYKIPIMQWGDWEPVLSLVLYLTLIVIMIRGWKKKSVFAYSIFFYLAALSIVSNLVISVGTFMNERFLFHASLGFCIAAAWFFIIKVKEKEILKRAGPVLLLLMVLIYSGITLNRIPDWKNGDALEKSAIKVSPGSARANLYYGLITWNNVFMKLPPGTDAARKRVVLDSIKPYFDKAVEILPSYKTANAMKAGMAGEYHKLDGDYSNLIKSFEEVNLTGTYEKFILDYLHYLNPRVRKRDDAKMLEAFYERMIPYYEKTYQNTNLPGEYIGLLNEIRQRIPTLQ